MISDLGYTFCEDEYFILHTNLLHDASILE
jgi:hypothetical protein